MCLPWLCGHGLGLGGYMLKKLVFVAVLPLVVALVGSTGAAAASGSVQSIPGTGQLFAIACPSATNCIAVGFAGDPNSGPTEGVVVPIMNGKPGSPQMVPDTDELLGIACSSSSSCVAVGGSAGNFGFNKGVFVPTINDAAVDAQVAPGSSGLNAVACNGNNCTAVGFSDSSSGGALVLPFAPGTASVPQVTPGIPQTVAATLDAITCPSATTCLAVGNSDDSASNLVGVAVTITNGTPGALKTMPGTGTFTISGVACASAIDCDAVGWSEIGKGSITTSTGVVTPITSGTPGAAHTIANYPLLGIACSSTNSCLAVGTNGTAAIPVNNGVPGSPQGVSGGSNFLQGATCANATTCWGVGGTSSEGALVGLTGTASYIALGDSYSSGEGNSPFMQPNTGCDRSVSKAWPELVANMFQVDVGLLACSGATTAALNKSYKDQVPQLKALKSLSTPTFITVTMGGNDLEFPYVLGSCFVGFSGNCVSALAGVQGTLAGGFGKHMTAVYKEIKAAAPGAHILVVGYPQIVPSNPVNAILHCPTTSIANVLLMRAVGSQLNSVLSRAAAAAGVSYVSTLNVLKGHELCTAHAWVNSIGLSGSGRGHPNAQGQAMIAAAVEDYVVLHHLLPGV